VSDEEIARRVDEIAAAKHAEENAALRAKLAQLLEGVKLEIAAEAEHDSWREQVGHVLAQIQSELITVTEGQPSSHAVLTLFGSLSCVNVWQRDLGKTYAMLEEEGRAINRARADKRGAQIIRLCGERGLVPASPIPDDEEKEAE
jgi:DNA-binding helix-hairpin-helix protein with protein kinase domain